MKRSHSYDSIKNREKYTYRLTCQPVSTAYKHGFLADYDEYIEKKAAKRPGAYRCQVCGESETKFLNCIPRVSLGKGGLKRINDLLTCEVCIADVEETNKDQAQAYLDQTCEALKSDLSFVELIV